MPKSTDLTGQVFGRLVVLRRSGTTHGNSMWQCLCNCGNTVIVQRPHLVTRRTQSCGCYRRELSTVHGKYQSAEYVAWCSLKNRCTNPSSTSYRYYGARGVSIAHQWAENFAAFYADLGPRPTSNHSVERVDNTKGYEPGNCRWATKAEQARNRSSNVLVLYNGRLMCLMDAAKAAGLPYDLLRSRRRRGWSDTDLCLPSRVTRPIVVLPQQLTS